MTTPNLKKWPEDEARFKELVLYICQKYNRRVRPQDGGAEATRGPATTKSKRWAL
jgi:hypothetical protein